MAINTEPNQERARIVERLGLSRSGGAPFVPERAASQSDSFLLDVFRPKQVAGGSVPESRIDLRALFGGGERPQYRDLGYPDLDDEDFDRVEQLLTEDRGFVATTLRGLGQTFGGENTPLGFGAARTAYNTGEFLWLDNKLRSGRASRDEQRQHLEMFAEMSRDPGIREMAGDIAGAIPGFVADVGLAVGVGARATKLLSASSRQAALRLIRDRAASEAMKAMAKRTARTVGAASAVAGAATGIATSAAVSELGPRAFGMGGGRWTAYALQKAMPQLLDMQPQDWEALEGLSNGALVKTLTEELPVWQGALDTVIELASEMAGAGIARGLRATVVGGYLLGAQKLVLDKIAARVGNRGPDLLEDLAKRARYEGPIVELLEERLGDAARVATGLETPDNLFPELDEFVAEVLALTFPAVGGAGVRRVMAAARPSQPLLASDFGGGEVALPENVTAAALAKLERVGVKEPQLRAPETPDEVEATRWAASRGRSLVLFDAESDAGVGGFAMDGGVIVVRSGSSMSPLALAGHELTETVGQLVSEAERAAQAQEVERRFPGLLGRALSEWQARVGAGGRATGGGVVSPQIARDEALATASEWVAPLMAYAARNAEAAAAVQELAQSPTGGGFWRGVLQALGRFFQRVINPNEGGGVARDLASVAGAASGLSASEAAQLSQLLSRWIDATQVEAQGKQAALQSPAAATSEAAAPVAGDMSSEAAASPPSEAAAEAPAARESSERERERDARERARRLAAIPLPGDVVMVREAGVSYTDDRGEAQVTYWQLTGRVLETLDGGRRFKVRLDEEVTRAFEQQRRAAENRGRRAELVRIINRDQLRIERREEPPAGSVRARLRAEALQDLQGLEVVGGRVVRADDAETEREAAGEAASPPRVGDVVRVTARGKQGLADVLAELRGSRLRVRLRPDAAGGALARSGSTKNRTVEVRLDEVQLYERRSPDGARSADAAVEPAAEAVATVLQASKAETVVPPPPTRKRQPKDWPNRAGSAAAPSGAIPDDARIAFVDGEPSRRDVQSDRQIVEMFNLDAQVEEDAVGVVAENMTDQPVMLMQELRLAERLVAKIEALGAPGMQTRYQGNKTNYLKKEARSLALALATAQDAETVFAMYAGGGSYELSLVGASVLPRVKRVVLNEVWGPRRARLELALAEGDAFMAEWETNATLKKLRGQLEAITTNVGKGQSPSKDALDFATGAETEKSKRSMYASFARLQPEIDGLSLRARAALQALHDMVSVKRDQRVTLQKALEEAAADMRTVKRHADAARRRGVTIEVVAMNAYGEDAIAMVRAEPRAVVFLDPPYHRADQGSYRDADGIVHDLGSDEQAAAFTYGAVQMAGDNLVVYHNNATPEVRDMLHSQLGDRMHLRLWRRLVRKKKDKPAEGAYEWTGYIYGRPGSRGSEAGDAAGVGGAVGEGEAGAGGPSVVGASGGAEPGSGDGGAVAARQRHPRGAFAARFEPIGGLTSDLERMLERGVAGRSVLGPNSGRRELEDFDPFTGLGVQPRADERAVDQSLQERLALRSLAQRKSRPLTLVDFVLSMGGLDLRGIMYTNETVEWAEALREAQRLNRRGIVGILKEATSKATERGGSPDDIREGLFGLGFRDPQESDGRLSFDTILDAMVTELNGGLPVFPADNQQWLEQEWARQDYLRHEQFMAEAPEDFDARGAAEPAPDAFDILLNKDVASSVVGGPQSQVVDDVDEEAPFAPAARTRSRGRIRRTLSSLVQAALSQASWRDWYDRHDPVLRELFLEDAELFQRLLAVTSQAASVQTNVALALKAYGQYLRGEPFVGYMQAVQRNLERVRAEEAASGPKIAAYDAATGGAADAVVVDRHIARLLFNRDVPNKAQIAAAQRRLRQVAEQLGWTPREVQAALWAFNQVRLGANPETIQSYDRHLERRRGAIAAVRAAFGRGEAGSLRPGAAAGPGADGAELGFGPDEHLRFAPAARRVLSRARSTPADEVPWEERREGFTLGERRYEIALEREQVATDAVRGMVSFSRPDRFDKYGMTHDSQDAATVLATVADFIFDEVLDAFAVSPRLAMYSLAFTAHKNDGSRVRLYEALARRLQRYYGVEVTSKAPDARTTYHAFSLQFTPEAARKIREFADRSQPLSPPRMPPAEEQTPFAPGIPPTARPVRDGEEFELGDEVGWEVAGPERPVRRFAAGTPGGDAIEAAWYYGLLEARQVIARLEGPYADEMRVVLDQLYFVDNIWPLVDDGAGDRFAPAIEVDGKQRPTLNSDGRPIAADEKGLRAFWRWFGDSIVVDAQGRPLVMYHGTRNDFTAFDTKRWGDVFGNDGVFGQGAYFTHSADVASSYARASKYEGSRVLPVYLRLLNPAILDIREDGEGLSTIERDAGIPLDEVVRYDTQTGEGRRLTEAATKRGFDGVVVHAREIVGRDPMLGIPRSEGVKFSEVVAFDPTQIKSAAGNAGTFDPTNPDIRFAPSGVARKASGLLRSMKEYLVSDVLDIEDLQAEVAERMQVGPDADFVGGIDLARSQAPARMDALLNRLLSQMGELKGHATVEDLRRLVYVKTAPARNAWLRVALADRYLRARLDTLRKQLQVAGSKMSLQQLGVMRGEVLAIGRVMGAPADQRLAYVRGRRVKIPQSPAGISDLDAATELARLRAKIGARRADAFLDFIRDENRAALDEMVTSGVLTAEKAREWHDREPYYVSLKDLDDELDADAGYGRPSRSMSVRGPLFRRAEGRETEAQHGLEAWLEDKLRRYEQAAKNRGMQTGAALARLDPAAGMQVLERAPRGTEVELSVPFFEQGQQRWLILPTVSAAKTLKGLHGRGVDPVLAIVGSATRMFSRAVTSRNPFFWLPNFLRDSGSALWTLTVERNFQEGAQVMARAWSVLPALLRHAVGRPSDLSAIIEQATQDGVKTTWVGLATLKERLQAMHDALAPKQGSLAFVRRGLRAMESVSDAFEMATRLAMYQHELARGRSRREAALAAKNITVNFDKKGTLTPSLAALYSFFNPAVQGARRVIQAATSSRRAVAMTAATATLGLLWEVLGYALSDDDEATGQAVYGMLADWTKDRNLHLPFAVGGVYLTYPLPYVISSIFGFGRRMAHLVAPGLDPKISRTKAIHDAVWQVINESQPLGDVRDPFVALAPTITKPFVELEQNVKFGGRPIQRDKSSFGETLPESARAFSTLEDRASGWLAQHIADALNAGGPAEVETGLDVSPAAVQHVINWIGSGFGLRELDRVSQFWLSSRDVPGLANTPLLRNFTNEQSSHAISENYYELRARADRVWRRAKDLRGAPRQQALAEDAELYAMAPTFRATDRRLRALRVRMEQAGRDERIALQEQRLAMQAALVRQYYGKQ